MEIYIAASMFSLAERSFNADLARNLKNSKTKLLLPQEFTSNIIRDDNFYENVFLICLQQLEKADVVIAIADGPDVDSGTSFELGYAFAKGVPVIAIRSDFRELEEKGVNLMISQCAHVFITAHKKNISELVNEIRLAIKEIFDQ